MLNDEDCAGFKALARLLGSADEVDAVRQGPLVTLRLVLERRERSGGCHASRQGFGAHALQKGHACLLVEISSASSSSDTSSVGCTLAVTPMHKGSVCVALFYKCSVQCAVVMSGD